MKTQIYAAPAAKGLSDTYTILTVMLRIKGQMQTIFKKNIT